MRPKNVDGICKNLVADKCNNKCNNHVTYYKLKD